ncbi:YfaP family protein [Planctomycetota bacterium]
MPQWYREAGGNITGPFELDELLFLVNRGRLTKSDRLRVGDYGPWRDAESFSELFPNAEAKIGLLPNLRDGEKSAEPELNVVAQRPMMDNAMGESPAMIRQTNRIPLTPRQQARRKQLLAGIGVGATCLLLVLLLLLLVRLLGTDDLEQMLAGHNGGAGQLPSSGSIAAHQEGDRPFDETGGESEEDDIVFEGEVDDDEPGGSSLPSPDQQVEDVEHQDDDSPGAFTVRRLESSPAAPRQGMDGGGLGEFKRRVEREGGQSGEVQITLIWNNRNDLDLHVICPSDQEISFRNKVSRCGGQLDVDQNASFPLVNDPVENIYWPEGRAPSGDFKVFVNYFKTNGDADPTNFKIAIKYDGRTKKFSGRISRHQGMRKIHEFTREPS